MSHPLPEVAYSVPRLIVGWLSGFRDFRGISPGRMKSGGL
jgi:hypothetical protein